MVSWRSQCSSRTEADASGGNPCLNADLSMQLSGPYDCTTIHVRISAMSDFCESYLSKLSRLHLPPPSLAQRQLCHFVTLLSASVSPLSSSKMWTVLHIPPHTRFWTATSHRGILTLKEIRVAPRAAQKFMKSRNSWCPGGALQGARGRSGLGGRMQKPPALAEVSALSLKKWA